MHGRSPPPSGGTGEAGRGHCPRIATKWRHTIIRGGHDMPNGQVKLSPPRNRETPSPPTLAKPRVEGGCRRSLAGRGTGYLVGIKPRPKGGTSEAAPPGTHKPEHSRDNLKEPAPPIKAAERGGQDARGGYRGRLTETPSRRELAQIPREAGGTHAGGHAGSFIAVVCPPKAWGMTADR